MSTVYITRISTLCLAIAVGAAAACSAGAAPDTSSTEQAVSTKGLTPVESLGRLLFMDKRLSDRPGQSCADCHAGRVGWTGPHSNINLHGAVYEGAIHGRFGNRKPPASAYATQSPVFHLDSETGLFVGGNFWDGRATGEVLGNPAADQAMGPFLNPVEQNLASAEVACQKVAAANYAPLFEEVWGPGSLDCSPAGAQGTYHRIALSIAEYEASPEVNAFSSKYDAFVAGRASLSDQELLGLELFNGKGMCSACHPAPLFTDYTFDNLGTPKNPENPFYRMDKVFVNGVPINPEGSAWVDPGLGGFLAGHPNPEWRALAADNLGKHKVPTLRNVDKRPGPGIVKSFAHNGFFKSLKELVHFYNTRDLLAWPAPEVAQNVNIGELGNLGLTGEEEDALVAFMGTLSDGYQEHK